MGCLVPSRPAPPTALPIRSVVLAGKQVLAPRAFRAVVDALAVAVIADAETLRVPLELCTHYAKLAVGVFVPALVIKSLLPTFFAGKSYYKLECVRIVGEC